MFLFSPNFDLPRMFRRAFSSLGRVAVGLGGVQLGAAAAVALTDKQLNKKPEWQELLRLFLNFYLFI